MASGFEQINKYIITTLYFIHVFERHLLLNISHKAPNDTFTHITHIIKNNIQKERTHVNYFDSFIPPIGGFDCSINYFIKSNFIEKFQFGSIHFLFLKCI